MAISKKKIDTRSPLEKLRIPAEEPVVVAEDSTNYDTDIVSKTENAEVEVEFIKKKVGRKPTRNVKETCVKINIALPKEMKETLDEIKILYDNNMTSYITKLIEKDLQENYEVYKRSAEMLNKLRSESFVVK